MGVLGEDLGEDVDSCRVGGWNPEFPGFPQAVEEQQECGREAEKFWDKG